MSKINFLTLRNYSLIETRSWEGHSAEETESHIININRKYRRIRKTNASPQASTNSSSLVSASPTHAISVHPPKLRSSCISWTSSSILLFISYLFSFVLLPFISQLFQPLLISVSEFLHYLTLGPTHFGSEILRRRQHGIRVKNTNFGLKVTRPDPVSITFYQ